VSSSAVAAAAPHATTATAGPAAMPASTAAVVPLSSCCCCARCLLLLHALVQLTLALQDFTVELIPILLQAATIAANRIRQWQHVSSKQMLPEGVEGRGCGPHDDDVPLLQLVLEISTA
jgi:hypothetical protein